jgi:hypothetical protein
MADHTTEALQSLVLMFVFMVSELGDPMYRHAEVEQNNRDRADAAWAILGAAIKVRRLITSSSVD